MNKNIYSIIFLSLLLVGMNYINAWTGPATSPSPTNAPNNNAAAPLTVGTSPQVKNGALGVTVLLADSVQATEYCDVTGTSCTKALPACSAGEMLMAGTAGSWKCGSITGELSCEVQFVYRITSNKVGTTTRTIFGAAKNMALGMHYASDQYSSYLQLTQELATHSWGSGLFDSSERGRVGFVSPVEYAPLVRDYAIKDARSDMVVKPLMLAKGNTLTITNEALSEVAAGLVRIKATVLTCGS